MAYDLDRDDIPFVSKQERESFFDSLLLEEEKPASPWHDAPGYQRCPECKGVGSFLVPTKSPLFAPQDEMTVIVACKTCKGARRVGI